MMRFSFVMDLPAMHWTAKSKNTFIIWINDVYVAHWLLNTWVRFFSIAVDSLIKLFFMWILLIYFVVDFSFKLKASLICSQSHKYNTSHCFIIFPVFFLQFVDELTQYFWIPDEKIIAIKTLICTQFFNENATSTLDCHNLTLLFRLPINVCAVSVPSDSLRAVTKIGERKKRNKRKYNT